MFHTAYEEKTIFQMQALVDKHRMSIDTFLREKLSQLNLLALELGTEGLHGSYRLKNLLRNLHSAYGYEFVDLGVIDNTGKQLAYAGPFGLEEADYSDASWFKSAREKKYYTSDVFLGLRGIPHFIVAVRVNDGGSSWMLRATIDFLAFNRLVSSIRMGTTGAAFIINDRGEFQTTARPEFEADAAYITEQIQTSQIQGDQVQAIKADSSEIPSVLYVVAPLKNGQWTLVFRQSLNEAFAERISAQQVTFVAVSLGVLAIFVMSVILSRRASARVAAVDKEREALNQQVIETGKLASLGELAAGIAHEINNPVAIMVEEAGWIQDLSEEGGLDTFNRKEVDRALIQIRSQGARCREITHKLLSFARRTDSSNTPLDVNEMVSEVLHLTEQRGRYANVDIKCHLKSGLPMVLASSTEMQQVLLNLVNNAIDAMPQGGQLILATDLIGHHVKIRISDTGEGIPESNLQRIFDPFYTTKPVGKGTGLGLSICYGIIQKLGGDITVQSEVGMGTTFNIALPLPSVETSGVSNSRKENCHVEDECTAR
jgi:two-component system NtrC family sensor kinase